MAKDKLEPEGGERWGIFGGLFNPIHHGHLITTQVCLEELSLDRFLFVPTKHPTHRQAPTVEFDDRFTMTQKAIEAHNKFHVSQIEAERSGPSYTYDTIQSLKKKYPDVELTLTVGMDELETFDQWHRWEKLLEAVTVSGLRRPDYSQGSVKDKIKQRVTIVDVPLIQISSTEIRRRINSDKPIRYYVPDSVNTYIKQRDLYRD